VVAAFAIDSTNFKINCLVHDTASVRLTDIITIVVSKTDNFNLLKDKAKEKSFLLQNVFQEGIVISRKDPNYHPQKNEDLIKTYNSDVLDSTWMVVDDPTELIVNNIPKFLREEHTHFIITVDRSRVEL
ncbi:4033_t:CDS:1, partial [Ambispora leptoticha]